MCSNGHLHQILHGINLTLNKIEAMKNILLKRHITLRSGHTYHVLKLDEIIFLEAIHSKTKAHYINHSIQEIEIRLDDIEPKLKDYPFWRSDRNHLINLKFLEKVSGNNDSTVMMKGDYRVPIDENRKTILFEELARL